MDIIVIDSEAYRNMLSEMKKAVKEGFKESGKETKEWLSTSEAKRLLGVRSKSKMQKLRDNGEIVFSQHGRIIRYSRKSILKFLNSNIPKF